MESFLIILIFLMLYSNNLSSAINMQIAGRGDFSRPLGEPTERSSLRPIKTN